MINATEFCHNINSNNLGKAITTAFDEIMVLYNVIGRRQDIDICTSDSLPFTFTILMDSESEAINLLDQINQMNFAVYGVMYHISMIRDGTSIDTKIMRAS